MTFSPAPSHQPTIDRGKALHELLRGRQLAKQLRSLIGKRKSPVADEAADLVVQILKSFATTISVLNSSGSSDSDSGEVSQFPVVAGSEDSGGDSCKSSSTRRGSYKKRRTENTQTKVTTDLTADGYAWRKYGQKDIHHTDFPRNYFRCTHKHGKPGCLATKQVQQISNDPPKFKTTYQNHHTCKNILVPPHFVFEPTTSTADDTSAMLCFQTNANVGHQDCRNYNNTLFSSSCFAKEEVKEEIKSDNNPSPDFNYMALADQLVSSDEQNANSCDTSSHSFEFDDFDFSVNVGNYYHYQ